MTMTTLYKRRRELIDNLKPYIGGLTRAQAAEALGIAPSGVTKLSSNENPLGASDAAVAALVAAAVSASHYPTSVATELHAAIARYLGVDAASVVSGAGSSTLMHSLVTACTDPGSAIVWISPGFALYQEIAIVHGRRPIAHVAAAPDFAVNPDALIEQIDSGTQLIFLTRPNNPTSVLIPLDHFRAVAEAAREVGAIVVSDEAYIEFAEDSRASAVELLRADPKRYDNVVVSRTFSKAFALANLRLGYMVASTEIAGLISAANAKWPTGDLVRAAGIAAIDDREHLNRTKAVVAEGRRHLTQRLIELGFAVAPAPQGNYVMVDVSPHGWNAAEFATDLLTAAHVMIRGDFSETYVRISIGTAEDNRRLLEGVEKILSRRAS
jgi:histidinol-phosphate aminotransferase